MNNRKSIKQITDLLKEDDEYYRSWLFNIAIQFQDEWDKKAKDGSLPASGQEVNRISLNAAKRVLNLLMGIEG